MTELIPMGQIGTPEAPVQITRTSNRVTHLVISFGPTPDDSVVAGPVLAGTLSRSMDTLKHAASRMALRNKNCGTICPAISTSAEKVTRLKILAVAYFMKHPEVYGRKYMREDMLVFTLRESMLLLLHMRSPHRDAYLSDTLDILMERSTVGWISKEAFQHEVDRRLAAEELATQLRAERIADREERARERAQLDRRISVLEKDKRLADEARVAEEKAASAAGAALNAHKGTKAFREGIN